ncbi:MAG: hypothetical protein HRU80_00025 [Ignavibacteriales bacterium]|nr:MAG: hypothetical protein HRU80_00025 [Ignavibacteriales bacterium]
MEEAVVALQYPGVYNFEKEFQVQTFNTNRMVGEALTKLQEAENRLKIGKYVRMGAAALFGIYVYIAESSIIEGLIAAAVIFGIFSVGTWVLTRLRNSADNNYEDAKWQHTQAVTQELLDRLGGQGYSFYDGTFLLYSEESMLYGDVSNGKLAGFARENIKEVMIEHVHLGSTTVGTSTSTTKGSANENVFGTGYNLRAKTTTQHHSETQDHYEWRLDILTNFMEYPRLKFVFPDNPEGEDIAKSIYAILKP